MSSSFSGMMGTRDNNPHAKHSSKGTIPYRKFLYHHESKIKQTQKDKYHIWYLDLKKKKSQQQKT
jgi:hypothetical protein